MRGVEVVPSDDDERTDEDEDEDDSKIFFLF